MEPLLVTKYIITSLYHSTVWQILQGLISSKVENSEKICVYIAWLDVLEHN